MLTLEEKAFLTKISNSLERIAISLESIDDTLKIANDLEGMI